jgi:ParB-like nuclease family protein
VSEYLGPGTAIIASLKLSGSFRQRLAAAHVKSRAESIETWGLLQRVVIRKEDMLVIAGEDRVAAHVLLERDDVPCEYWKATDEEVRGMRAVENGHRRHSKEEQTQSTLEAFESWKKVFDAEGDESPKEAAIQQLAKERGVKPGTVERAISRDKKRENDKLPPDPNLIHETLPYGFEHWGVDYEPEFLAHVLAVTAALKESSSACSQAQAAITRAIEAGHPEPARLKRIAEDIHEAGAALRDLLPACICLWCKCTDVKCTVCGGYNWNTAEKLRGAPAALRDWENPKVMKGGKLVPMEVSEPEPAAVVEKESESLEDML